MKLVLLVILLGITNLIAQNSYASAPAVSLSLCPQDGRNDENAFHTSSMNIDSGSVNLSYGGSEPNFSSEIQWLANGAVTLVRKNKETIVLGQGERPVRSSACGKFPFQLSDAIQVELHTKFGLPHPICSIDSGCKIVHPRTDTLSIRAGEEVIVYLGNQG